MYIKLTFELLRRHVLITTFATDSWRSNAKGEQMPEIHRTYADEELLLSGIQHYFFCSRQWALIHIGQIWEANYFTSMGDVMHERVHNDGYTSSENGSIIERSVPLFSKTLGVYGISDIVEFRRDTAGVSLKKHAGSYSIFPIEYKRGKTKSNDCDRAQLCLQALCLEEMFNCSIPRGAIYYGKTRHREYVELENSLRESVINALNEMHELMDSWTIPAPLAQAKQCKSCSLIDSCLPARTKTASDEFDRTVAQILREK
jgi:CRISPR-associated exonuclease Cas4